MKRLLFTGFAALAIAGCLLRAALPKLRGGPKTTYFVYVATGASSGSGGIQVARFDPADGRSEPFAPAGDMAAPLFFTTDASSSLLFAVTQATREGKPAGIVSSFRINRKTGALKLINNISSGGQNPCHIAVEQKERMLLVTNCGSGSIASFWIQADGTLGEAIVNVQHPAAPGAPQPHPTSVAITRDNYFLFVPDSGLDKVFSYRFDPVRVIFWPNVPAFTPLPPGSGPRRLVFHPEIRLRFGYGLNGNSSTVTVFGYHLDPGSVTVIQTIATLPGAHPAANPEGDMVLDSAGRNLYVSNSGDASVTVFSIDKKLGTLENQQNIPSGGKSPESIRLDPTGRFLFVANRGSDSIALFRVEPKDGALTSAGKALPIKSPGTIRFVPAL